ncbi:uncharacterized protein LACBIDRAFT_327929 [Laccaria bicolor S238N-H82]|uniref:Predicted protein n=1 Tax=Laccaria bicolor (strain S238N-H82 / ATCC MYA-4686) TaxID=486041 RepID=B0DD89_LACBS|nr:uncharacterized protein LACBIDRAFT_327929 [Laccaria bicolor S238N-H82]EDR07435.1 predicted protein [Laccaria bicolor S238N-H82]|eukprot:XP_001881827.1 predicted protein [Laccaria bicolor S238N-H82]
MYFASPNFDISDQEWSVDMGRGFLGSLAATTCGAGQLIEIFNNFVKACPLSLDTAIQVSCSHHTSSSQTSPPPLLVNAEAQAQPMDLTPAATTTSTLDSPAFDWSEDAAAIPITPIFPKNQPYRDLSAVRTSKANPFSSLAHRNRCSQLPLGNCDISGPQPPFRPCQAPPFSLGSQTTPLQCFIPLFNPTTLPLPSTPLKIPSALDWESNPCLLDLSRALKALGWIHQ